VKIWNFEDNHHQK